ncbi:hypothetical protein K461DRAFT_297263 [Myriangium duriaei CBS 260.36]|uniref:Uncharacterized protein n=1 Tax=Myriangium duriaei CBS 260.36 TaxID=1168546 RepID=A0A9P4MIF4_9PEZI|nr:hypothetical protein K461DRAFT_297263 [Myriangium duriaei CBS 260.36]
MIQELGTAEFARLDAMEQNTKDHPGQLCLAAWKGANRLMSHLYNQPGVASFVKHIKIVHRSSGLSVPMRRQFKHSEIRDFSFAGSWFRVWAAEKYRRKTAVRMSVFMDFLLADLLAVVPRLESLEVVLPAQILPNEYDRPFGLFWVKMRGSFGLGNFNSNPRLPSKFNCLTKLSLSVENKGRHQYLARIEEGDSLRELRTADLCDVFLALPALNELEMSFVYFTFSLNEPVEVHTPTSSARAMRRVQLHNCKVQLPYVRLPGSTRYHAIPLRPIAVLDGLMESLVVLLWVGEDYLYKRRVYSSDFVWAALLPHANTMRNLCFDYAIPKELKILRQRSERIHPCLKDFYHFGSFYMLGRLQRLHLDMCFLSELLHYMKRQSMSSPVLESQVWTALPPQLRELAILNINHQDLYDSVDGLSYVQHFVPDFLASAPTSMKLLILDIWCPIDSNWRMQETVRIDPHGHTEILVLQTCPELKFCPHFRCLDPNQCLDQGLEASKRKLWAYSSQYVKDHWRELSTM